MSVGGNQPSRENVKCQSRQGVKDMTGSPFSLRAMLHIILFLSITVSALQSHAADAVGHTLFEHADGNTRFESFKSTYSKQYGSEAEHNKRAAAFDASLVRIARKHTDGDATAGVTQFSDLSPAEFKKRLSFRPSGKQNILAFDYNMKLPQALSSADWRTRGGITDVKNQDNCNSCWAHSAVEQIESQWQIAGHNLTTLSVQEVASCTHCYDCGGDMYNDGCTKGGDNVEGILYAKEHGVVANSVYPYADEKKKCNAQESNGSPVIPKGFVTGYTWATPPCKEGGQCNSQDEDTLRKYISSVAPASICVNAENWQDYNSGIYTAKACGSHSYNSMDHCAQLVGYSNSSWIVRNSWGKKFGEEGYIRLEMGKNTCSLASYAATATVSGIPTPSPAESHRIFNVSENFQIEIVPGIV